MRMVFVGMLLLTTALLSPLRAEEVIVARDTDSEFQVDLKIVEVRRDSLTQLGFDLSPERPDQQSPLSASEFRSQRSELMKSRKLKDLGGLPMMVTLNKPAKFVNGGEFIIGDQLFETGTRIEITPIRQPDDSLKLEWSASIGEMVQPPKKLLQRKKNPIVNRREWRGDCMISDTKPVFMIPDVAPEQDWIVVLQFHIEELPKPRISSADPIGRASIAK